MAAAVEQHHIAGLRLFQAVQQAVEIQRVVGGVVVGVFQHFQAHGAKDVLVVRPAWVANPDAFGAGLVSDKVCRNAQAAGAAWRLCGARATIGDDRALFAEQQFLRAAGERRDALNTEIVFGGLIFQQILLSFLRWSAPGFTGFVFINANP